MNVLLLTDKLAMGGAEMYYCKLANYLEHPEMTFHFAAGGGELYKKVKHKDRFTELSLTNHMQNVRKLASIVKHKKIRLIHANSLRMVLYCNLVKMILRRPLKIIYTKHNVTLLERKFKLGFKYLLNKHVDKIIAVSDFEKENLEKLGVESKKIETIYNGVDLQQFLFQPKIDGEILKIGMLARLSEEKNHELFIKIANDLKENSNFVFFIAGDGPERNRIARMIQDLDLTHSVKLMGEVQDPETFIREMDVLLLTSHREVFPMVIIESMAVGTPVLSIDRGGIKEAVVDNETGILINEHSSDEFTKNILKLLSDDQGRIKMIEQARKKVEMDFSLDQMLQRTLREYVSCG